MKKLLVLGTALLLAAAAHSAAHKDGTYRGNFMDGSENQVTVEFVLKNDVVESAKFRHLFYKKADFLKDEKLAPNKAQYEAALAFAVGKNVDTVLDEMYDGSKIEKAGASVRVTKIRSAIKDGILHGAYTPAKK